MAISKEAKAAYDKSRRDITRGRYKDRRRNRYKNDPAYREKHAAWAKEKYATDPEFKTRARHGELKRRYSLTPEAYNRMLQEQDGRCALCDELFKEGFSNSPRVDHCHDSGRVRGLLCNTCNLREGWVRKVGLSKLLAYYGQGDVT